MKRQLICRESGLHDGLARPRERLERSQEVGDHFVGNTVPGEHVE